MKLYICSWVKTGNGSADVCWGAEWRRDGRWEGRFRTANTAGHRLTVHTKPQNPQALLTTALASQARGEMGLRTPQFKRLDVVLRQPAVQSIIRNYTFYFHGVPVPRKK